MFVSVWSSYAQCRHGCGSPIIHITACPIALNIQWTTHTYLMSIKIPYFSAKTHFKISAVSFRPPFKPKRKPLLWWQYIFISLTVVLRSVVCNSVPWFHCWVFCIIAFSGQVPANDDSDWKTMGERLRTYTSGRVHCKIIPRHNALWC